MLPAGGGGVVEKRAVEGVSGQVLPIVAEEVGCGDGGAGGSR